MTIRKAVIEDSQSIFDLIMELALYEKAPEKVANSPEQIAKDGFGETPLFECIVAEDKNKIIGMSLYYFRYSTWKGKVLFLEDLIVRKENRGKGYGKKLLSKTIEIAKDRNCKGVAWQVLDWNTPAIEFYKNYNVTIDDDWLDVKMWF